VTGCGGKWRPTGNASASVVYTGEVNALRDGAGGFGGDLNKNNLN
jgi:hypothetical protein